MIRNYYEDYYCGLIVIQDTETGLKGYADRNGNVVIPCQYEYASSFDDYHGVVRATVSQKVGFIFKSEKFFYIDRYGERQSDYYDGIMHKDANGHAVATNNGSHYLLDEYGRRI